MKWVDSRLVMDGIDYGHTYKCVRTGRIRGYGYGNDGVFCRLRCGYDYGMWASAKYPVFGDHLPHCYSIQTKREDDCNCR